MSKLISLDAWASATYGDAMPCPDTLRRWCREGRIYPQPQKHGRCYWLEPNAQYVDINDTSLLARIRKNNVSKAA